VSRWPSLKARVLLRTLMRQGWVVKRQRGSHRILARPGWPDYLFAFHDGDEIGGVMVAEVARHTGLAPDQL
jgi:predicted RNA binding protein YcfA (HicA-like mRNA interferase family)